MATAALTPTHAQSWIDQPKKQLIGGEWVDSTSGETFEVYDPSSGDVIAHVPKGTPQDIDKAVAAARKAFDHGPWRRMSPSDRSRILFKVADLIEDNADQLAELESVDNGKPITIARAADVVLAADMFRYMAGWVTKIKGDTFHVSVPYAPDAQFHTYTQKEPIGVAGQIIPWNFPLLMAAWKLAPALAAGCCIVLKPAEQTPLSALRLSELILEAGLPEGVLNTVNGFGEDTGAPLAAHPDVDKIAFTGSTEVGKMIAQAAGRTNLKKVTLELGGKSPNIVFADAPREDAIAGAANAIFFNHGQCCAAGSRLYVEESAYDEVISGVAAAADKIKVGPGLDPSTEMGPLVSEEQMQKVTGYLKAGAEAGASNAAKADRSIDQGYFVQPSVLDGTTSDMSVVREEIFGPVVVAQPFDSLEQIAANANDTTFGLASGIWTSDLSRAHRLAPMLRAGTVWINCYNVFDAALPFGGYKESGWGREMGGEAIENYLETKAVCIGL